MIILLIASFMITIGVPTMLETIVQNRISTGVRSLHKDLIYARSYAISNQLPVVLCNLDKDDLCTEDGWNKGYTIFLDANGDSLFTVGIDAKLRANNDFDYGVLSLSNGADEVIFSANGRVNSILTFTYCPSFEKSYARGVVINQLGRPKLTSDYDDDGLDETTPANNDSHLICI
jgi:Tfp pilus assembly protein FimT